MRAGAGRVPEHGAALSGCPAGCGSRLARRDCHEVASPAWPLPGLWDERRGSDFAGGRATGESGRLRRGRETARRDRRPSPGAGSPLGSPRRHGVRRLPHRPPHRRRRARAPEATTRPRAPDRRHRQRPGRRASLASRWVSGSASPGSRWTCGRCRFCVSGRENLCEKARFTGYDVDGGFADETVADERYCFPIPSGYPDVEAAPLLCAGLIGYRAYSMTGAAERIGLYGFGAAAHIVCQVALAEGRRVFALTRPGDADGQAFARHLGAEWRRLGRAPAGGTRRGHRLRSGRRARPAAPRRPRRAVPSSARESRRARSRASPTSCCGASAASGRWRT